MKKILVVNNDLDSMNLLKSWLEIKSYQVKITTSREEVPRLVRDFKPGLVIADIVQNRVITDLKENANTSNIPVLLMSGYSKGLENAGSGADDVIEKPFNLSLFEFKLKKLLKIAG